MERLNQMDLSIMELGIPLARSMVMESRSGQTHHATSEIGKMIRKMVLVSWCTQMEMSMKVTGSMIKLMEKEPTSMQMEPLMRVTGTRINSMAGVLRPGLMVLAMKAATKMERKMGKES